jgi:Tfp pilus assembly protein PilN
VIEVNLLPGGKKRRPSKGGGGGGTGILSKLSLPDMGSLLSDSYTIGAAVVGIGVLVILGWWYVGLSSAQADIEVELADALQDSANYADLIERNATLAARRDSIAQKVDIIQEIDALRYVWPHLLDELARALPDYTWLTQVIQVSVGDAVEFQVRGRAGNNRALTTFWRQLQESPFIRSVQLVQTEQVLEPTGQLVYAFQLDCVYTVPPLDLIETIPLFQDPITVNE